MHPETSLVRDSFINKWGLIIRAAGITGILLIVRPDHPYDYRPSV